MRRLLALSLSLALLAVPAALAASSAKQFKGSSKAGAVSFAVSGKRVKHFRFVNACPAESSKGTLVNGSMKIKTKAGKRTFSLKNEQFTIKGRFVSASKAKGTAQNDTGDCHSGKLSWTASLVK